MDPTRRAIDDAWRRVGPMLQKNPAELNRRLARLAHQKLFRRPPRAWCLAVRASDTRLDRYLGVHPNRAMRHDLAFDSAALRRLCAPVFLNRPGDSLAETAALLGVTPRGLLGPRLAGVFRTRYQLPRAGKPQPLLYSALPLDPAARAFTMPDPIWSITAECLTTRIPKKFRQLLTRIPLYQKQGPHYADADALHPEHPDLDPPPPRRRNQTLPPPSPHTSSDATCWYKWKGDEYLGYDWSQPGQREHHEQRQKKLARQRDTSRKRRREKGSQKHWQGSLRFQGWRWLCPMCDRAVNVLFLPLPRLHLLEGRWINRLLKRIPHPPGPPQTFACEQCHRIKRFSGVDPNTWNEIVTYLSAGLLYGKEVQRPDWLPHIKRSDRSIFPSPPHLVTPSPPHLPNPAATDASIANRKSAIANRKIPYTPRPNRDPSTRRPQIEALLLAGRSFKQIAAALRTPTGQPLARGTVLWHAQQVYKANGVRTLPELLAKHQKPIPGQTHLTPEIRRRLLAGHSIPTIERELGVTRMIIYNQKQLMRKKGIPLPNGSTQYHARRGKRFALQAKT